MVMIAVAAANTECFLGSRHDGHTLPGPEFISFLKVTCEMGAIVILLSSVKTDAQRSWRLSSGQRPGRLWTQASLTSEFRFFLGVQYNSDHVEWDRKVA